MKPLGEKDGARLQCQGISPSSLPVLGHADAAPLHWPCDCSAEGSLPGCWAGGGGKVCVFYVCGGVPGPTLSSAEKPSCCSAPSVSMQRADRGGVVLTGKRKK